ncbi:hypothetical protein GQ457_11G023930 [Hibiscus cannabinus]
MDSKTNCCLLNFSTDLFIGLLSSQDIWKFIKAWSFGLILYLKWYKPNVQSYTKNCTDVRKLGCAISLLHGDAYHWWTTTRASVAEANVNWEFFLTAFRRKYLGPQY